MIVKEVQLLPTHLPSVVALQDAVKKARDWVGKLEALQKLEYSPYLEALENLLNKAKPIAIKLDPLDDLENQIAAAHAWRERTAKTFLRKNSYYTLIEVLSPKSDVLGTNFFNSFICKYVRNFSFSLYSFITSNNNFIFTTMR